MSISSTVFWVLVSTVIFAVIAMIFAILWMYLRRKKIIAKYKKEENESRKELIKVRDNLGELLWEEKNKSESPLDDYQMEFAINTVFRNDYKTFNVLGFKTEYEKKSLSKLSKSKFVAKQPDFLLMNGEIEELNNVFDKNYNDIKAKNMIMIANASRKKPEIKRLLEYLKVIKAKYDWSKYGKGVLVVVK